MDTKLNKPVLIADQFLQAIKTSLEPLRGHILYNLLSQGYLDKTGQTSDGYARWLKNLVIYLVEHYQLNRQPKILDLGCGTGEFVVTLNVLGYDTVGIDVHHKHLELAKILAAENNLMSNIFIENKQPGLPFADNSFDVVMLNQVVEHLDNPTIKGLLPEIFRVCRGVVYVTVPNKWRTTDDHTLLHWVPWLPRSIAKQYIKLRGPKYRYAISDSGEWDVHFRTMGRINKLFETAGFKADLPPDELVYPPLDEILPVFQYKKGGSRWKQPIYLALETLHDTLVRLGLPKESLYTYLNLVYVKPK